MDSDVRDRQDEQEEENRRKNTHTNQPYPSTFNKKTCCDCTSANTDQNLCDLCFCVCCLCRNMEGGTGCCDCDDSNCDCGDCNCDCGDCDCDCGDCDCDCDCS